MSFTSLHFLLFFPIVTRLYFIVPYRQRWGLLVIASYYFYMSWRPWYALLLLFATVVTFICGLLIGAEASQARRRAYLIAGCTINLAVLFVFKYFDFLNTQTRDLMALIGVDYKVPNLDLILPVAISFHTFQVLSYLFDVYRRDVAPERHLGIFALYVVYYPQLVAGPIERAFHFLPQLRLLRTPDPKLAYDETRAVDGLRLVLRGFVKKIIVADNSGAVRRPYLQRSCECDGHRVVRRNHRIRVSDLFRFFRLHRHRPRLLARHGPGTGSQFPPSLSRAFGRRLLEALAHLAHVLVPRLRLSADGRQPRRPTDAGSSMS